MEYNFRKIEQYWQQRWKDDHVYQVSNDAGKPKYYVLDMFPYPSGAGLHVGHPLGYIASDIFARFKRLKGFNVLHPMGYDAFGLPAEQYAIEHGIHPAVSTDQNIRNFRAQLDKIGFCFDWSREVKTSDPSYYKWTQWIFLRLFESFYNRRSSKAEPLSQLIEIFEKHGNHDHPIPNAQFEFAGLSGGPVFSAKAWHSFDERTQHLILMEYRLAYCGFGEVNWCEALGTVLANDEVINGLSERGGYPVVKKKLRQWYLRITEYADRLLEGLERVEFSDAMKDMQTNWIGKSYGAEINFPILAPGSNLTALAENEAGEPGLQLRVYTTRPDTIFGVDFMVIAPEHPLTNDIVTDSCRTEVDQYLQYVKSRSERERMADKKITGVYSGSYCAHAFNNKKIPIWISEYVLAGYGTGAIMAVPCGDERDFKFARHFNIPITNIIGKHFNGEESNPTRDAVLENSDFLDGMVMWEAIREVITRLETLGIGKKQVNYKMRDAAFSRQRYWGEPFPIRWKEGIAHPLSEHELPLQLPHVESYRPGPEGEGPLANVAQWTQKNLETNTMPGYAGSSWYFLRYMDPHDDAAFCSREASDYWGQVDLYIGGTEHAVGHLLYSRMWTKFLYDQGLIGHDEPFRKLVNQGMIQGSSRFVYRLELLGTGNIDEKSRALPVFISGGKVQQPGTVVFHDLVTQRIREIFQDPSIHLSEIKISELHVDVNMVDGVDLDLGFFKHWRNGEYSNAAFILDDGSLFGPSATGKYLCGTEVEKMSKRYFNTVNPIDLCDKFGADTFRMYEMFLGPVEQSKPWDTKGIEGVHRFLKKVWRLFYDDAKGKVWNDEQAIEGEMKILHRTIRKIEDDTERLSFNTGVSAFMIAVNELGDLKCHKKEVLEKILILLSPYAPHIAEELWHLIGNPGTILDASFPKAEEKYLTESTKNYPIALNGKTRTELNISLDATQQQVENMVLANETIQKWLEGRQPKKIIYVRNKIINVVV